LAMYTIPMLTGPMIGPVIGGVLVSFGDWRWIYFINAPMSLLAAFLIYRLIDHVPREQVAPLDWVGWLLSGIALGATGAVLTAMGKAPAHVLLIAGAVGVVAGIVFLWHARRAPAPALDMSLFRLPIFSVGIYASSFVRMPLSAGPFLLSLLLQVALGLNALVAGGFIMLNAIGALFMRAVAGRLSARFGLLRVTHVSALISAISIGCCAAFTGQTPLWLLGAVLFLHGFSRSLALTNLTAVSFADVPQERMAPATSVFSVAQLVSHAFAVATCAIVVDLARMAFGDQALQPRDVAPAFLLLGLLGLLALPSIKALPQSLDAEFGGRV
jgi:MFS family permease